VVGRHLIVGSVAGALTVGLVWLGYGEGAWHERRREPAIPPTEAAITSVAFTVRRPALDAR
jgi:hypothetical protein